MNILLGSVAGSINISVSPVGPVYDVDALTYIQNVEAADGQGLEEFVKTAINTFVVDLKTDGIWSNIITCGILAGARTLSGALVPLKGATPTNYNFVGSDYTRSQGLSGDGLTKYIDTNEPTNSRPLTSSHISVYMSKNVVGISGNPFVAGTFAGGTVSAQDAFYISTANLVMVIRRGIQLANPIFTGGNSIGFKSFSRSSSTFTLARSSGVELTSTAPVGTNLHSLSQYLFAARSIISPFFPTGFVNAGLTFYSIGSATNIRLLEQRVLTLMGTLSTIT